MRRLLSLACAALAASAVCATPALRSSSREVPVYEDTAVPGAGSTYYSLCATLDLSVFTAAIAKQSDECAIKTSYMWTGSALPTATERRELCSCTDLIAKLQKVKVPRCSLFRDGREISYAQLVRYAFGLCSLDGSKASATTTSPSKADTSDLPPSSSVDTVVTEPKAKSKSKTGVIVGILVALVVVGAIVAFVVVKQRQRRRAAAKDETNQDGDQDVIQAMPLSPLDGSSNDYVAVSPAGTTTAPAYPVTTGKPIATVQSTQRTAASTGSSGVPGPHYDMRASQMGMWDDPVLLAVRIPYDTVFFGPLLSRGGYGEVYKGTYKGETVAIKQLLPERRKDLTQIDAFLSEIKLMSTLEHERIIRFLGVAWNSLSDACVIVEYMENGDLRSVLSRWDRDEHRPQGFDADKVKVALHIAHALTYLHSLQPVVVHRDLKSKNILLNASYDAKLTDFGVSRERADSTMTGGVGSSLWMAPEVMLGERYDEKADVFSFGVVLSELDTQKLPYDHAKETGTDRKVADSAILQMVSLGRLQIAFTEHAHPDLVQLGRDCVQLDAKARPTSAELLHRVHQVFRSL